VTRPEALGDLAARMQAHAPCGLVCFTDDGIVRYANPALHGWLEQPPGTLAGTRFDAMLSPASRVFLSTHLFPLLKLHGFAEEVHFTLRTVSGEDVPVLVNALRDLQAEEPLNYCGLLTMRQRREFESALVDARRAAEAATAAKDQFLAVVSHELRTPLNAIAGWVRIARSGAVQADLMERALEAIERNAHMQAQLIEDLLDVSRIVSGKMRISLRPLNLASVVEAAAEGVRPAALAKNISLVVTIDSHAGIVHADRVRMQQIAWNLVSNAIKFTPKGGRVHVSLTRAGSRVQVAVADTGIGIAPDKLPYVFERFWQESVGGSPQTTGLGLGLAICRSLVELHGGTLRAESAGAGKGALFVAEFPIAVSATPEAEVGTPAELARPPLSLDGVQVLVVDDDPDARVLVRMLLEGVGARVVTAASADEALQSMARTSPHVLVSDVGMPGKDGYALIRELRTARPDADVAAIAVTGLGRSQDRIELLRAGFQAHVVKPVDPDELVALVRALARR